MTFRIQTAGWNELRALGKDLKRAGAGMRPKVTKAIREPTKEIHDTIRAAILGADMSARRTRSKHTFTAVIPSQGVKKPTANALSWKVSTSSDGARADIDFNPQRMPLRIRQLFAYWVGQLKRLRHPIMGKNPDGSWRGGVGQSIPNVWAKVDALIPKARRAVAAAMDETAAEIAGRKR